MILLLDNYDSFTYNLYQQAAGLGGKVRVFKNDEITIEEIKKLKPSKIIISPGPKKPDSSGISLSVIKNFFNTLPILGVCLGHQCIGHIFGSKIIHAKNITHGKTSDIHHTNKGLFKGLPNKFKVARYHSLAIDQVPDDFELSAWAEDGEIMAIHHKKLPVYGIQFHPESFMSEYGDEIMRNFLQV